MDHNDDVPVADFRDFFDTAPTRRMSVLVAGRLVNGEIRNGAFVPDDKAVNEELAENFAEGDTGRP